MRKRDITILVYHQVLDLTADGCQYSPEGMVVSKRSFQKQMDYLSKKYTIISFNDLLDLKNGKDIPQNACIITFDDGWKDNFLNALPILSSLNIPATIFLTTNYIEGNDVFWYTKLIYLLKNAKWSNLNLENLDTENHPEQLRKELKMLKNLPKPFQPDDFDHIIDVLKCMPDDDREKIISSLSKMLEIPLNKLENKDFFLSWKDINQMSEGNISFSSHGCSHRILTRLSQQAIINEIHTSKGEIENHINHKKGHEYLLAFSYPNGDWNSMIRNFLKEAGYQFAVTCDYGLASPSDEPLSLKRINIHDGLTRDIFVDFLLPFFVFELTGIRSLLKSSRKRH